MSGREKAIEWEVDGKRFRPSETGTLDWPLERGRHTIKLVKHDLLRDSVQILVR
jgi:hypothetical protein